MSKLKIEYVPIETIQVYPGNAKLHPAEQIEQIKESIRQFSMNDPIGVWHDTIVEGHGRYIACKELGIDKIPIIRLDELTDEQRKAYALAHNKLTMNSDFDPALLDIELDSITDIDMSALGFDITEDDEESDETGTPQETNFNYQEQYGVIVMCKDEQEQETVYNRLIGEGYECKVVAV